MWLPPSDVSLSSQWVRRSSKLPEWLTCIIIRRQNTTSNRAMKSPPAKVTGNKRWHLLKLQQLSSHCRSDYFGSTKIVSSNSFGQNKIGHKFCLPKTDPSNSRRITCWKPTYVVQNLQPALKASENIDSGQFGLKPRKTRIPRHSSSTIQHPNSQDRRLLEVMVVSTMPIITVP